MRLIAVGACLTLAYAAAPVWAQDAVTSGHEVQYASAERGPAFYYAPSSAAGTASERRDARNAAVFRRRVSLDMRNAPVTDVLTEIARQAGLHLLYSPELVPASARVTVQVRGLTVAAAMTEVLIDAGVDVELVGSDEAMLVRHGAPLVARQQGGGTIRGRVVDGVTRTPLDQVAVRVEGTNLGAVTASGGGYMIRSVPASTYRITARRVGYTPLTKSVIVALDSTVTADFALAAAPTRLNEMVTTAVGDQRRYQIGNDIATINADSIAPTAPITNLTDLLSGRTPGVEVLEQQGQVGAGPRIRIRGLSSFSLSNDPIIYIDGERLDNAAGSANGATPAVYAVFPTPSRLNDIDPADIESIDVLKGPSAASEYGTDAANGVILIKTKRGMPGPPQWNIHAEHGVATVPTHFVDNWEAFGHTTDASRTPVTCLRVGPGGTPTVANGECAIDSTTRFQPLNDPATTMFGTGPSSRVGADVSGGTQAFRYYLGGSYNQATGVLKLPQFEQQQLRAAGTPIPGYQLHPNALDQSNLGARTTASLGNAADIGFTASYAANTQRSGVDGLPFTAVALSPGYRDPAFGGYGFAAGLYAPVNAFAVSGSEGIDRFSASSNLTWRPAAWLSTHAIVGVDLGSRTDDSFLPAGRDPIGLTNFPGSSGTGYHGIGRRQISVYTVDIGATATTLLSAVVTAKTSAGVQFNAKRDVGTLSQAYGLTANGSINGASAYQASQVDTESRTLGSYVEETVGWRDRLFVTGAMRLDVGSGFGSQIHSAAYPKGSISWTVLQAANGRLRLRAAYGESGVQPPSGATLSLYTPATVTVGGASVAGDTLVSVGNARLKPERSTEIETGFDAGLFGDRLTAEFTYYNKLSHNTIVGNVLPGSDGASTEFENLGEVRNYGVEGSVTLGVLQTRPLAWDLTVSGAINQNRLVSLAPGVPPINAPFFPFILQYRQVAGYPLFGYWGPNLIYADANHDGLIEPGEVSETPTVAFQGSPIPTREVTLSSGLSAFGRAVHIGLQVDYRGGNKIQNLIGADHDQFPYSAALNDPHAPLADQARAVEIATTFGPLTNAYFEDGSFVRWRELSVTYLIPSSMARALHVRAASITALGRNLALWTRYSGPDPEVNSVGNTGGAPPDGVFDDGVTPLTRAFAFRINVGF